MNNEYKNNTYKKATNYVLPENASELNIKTLESNNIIFGNDLLLNKYPKKIGNLNAYFYYKNYPLILINFPQMYLFLIYQIFINLFFFLTIKLFHKNLYNFLEFLYIISYIIPVSSHLIIFFMNPGTPKFNLNFYQLNQIDENEKKNFMYCKICNIIVKIEDDVVHCDECNVCVMNYDHHCYWTSKCITNKNICFFYCFIFGTIIFAAVFSMCAIYFLYNKMIVLNKKK